MISTGGGFDDCGEIQNVGPHMTSSLVTRAHDLQGLEHCDQHCSTNQEGELHCQICTPPITNVHLQITFIQIRKIESFDRGP